VLGRGVGKGSGKTWLSGDIEAKLQKVRFMFQHLNPWGHTETISKLQPTWGKHFRQRSCKCKGPGAETGLYQLRTSKEASLTGGKFARGEGQELGGGVQGCEPWQASHPGPVGISTVWLCGGTQGMYDG
jgi:hypothetical protein